MINTFLLIIIIVLQLMFLAIAARVKQLFEDLQDGGERLRPDKRRRKQHFYLITQKQRNYGNYCERLGRKNT